MLPVSLIIPTVNRAEILPAMLRSLAAVVRPRDPVEVIVVDNGSTDRTPEVCSEIREMFPRHEWRYFHEPIPGLLSGRHRGAREARGEILSYLDDDVLLSPTWLEGVTEAFANPQVALVGGPSAPEFQVKPPEWFDNLWDEDNGHRMLLALSLIDSGTAVRWEDPLYVLGLNLSIRRSVFDRCGGFHPDGLPTTLQRYRGDGETGLTLKVKAAGFQALYHPQVAVQHVIPASRMTIESFERRGFYQGICDSYTQIRSDRGRPPAPRRTWKDLLRPAKWKLERDLVLRRPTAEGVRSLMARSHFAGVQFHRNEVCNDPKLLDWVRRQNYFDYRLPDGWEQHLH